MSIHGALSKERSGVTVQEVLLNDTSAGQMPPFDALSPSLV